ncbi:hypothetical protein, partial [Pseudomonas sp. NPDC087626]|uniref:hypothetical protein n=1 Tax=Pseudomonas sp. NPDC087626 TaxID=3364444 RepID=UPI00380CE925
TATLYVVDGAHYTERRFNCKPLISKKQGKFYECCRAVAFRRQERAFGAFSSLKFPVSLRLCQTNPHIDKVKTL